MIDKCIREGEYKYPLKEGFAKLIRKSIGNESVISIELDYKGIYGLGEKFDALNQKGKEVTVKVKEKFCNQGDVSYCVTPFFCTDSGFGLYIHTKAPTSFSFQEKITCTLPKAAEVTVFTGSLREIIADYIGLLGKYTSPPLYAFGPWISANHWNSQKDVDEQLRLLEEHKFPATVMVLEAWSDEATFYIFNGASYKPVVNGGALGYEDFDFENSTYWDNPKKMIKNLHDKGIRLVLWQIPVYKKMEPGIYNEQNSLDREDAVRRKLCVMNQDGTPYEIPQGNWFEGSYIPDFTRQETVKSWFDKRRYLLEIGVDGFKTDGGEFIYKEDLICANGDTGKEAVNQYSQDYINAYANFINKEMVLFSRAGYAGAHKASILWAGDHLSTNDEFKATLVAGLSSAMSGISYWSFDIGGFAGTLPSMDLYLRSTMLACFTPIMQWHSEPDGGQFKEILASNEANNERSPWNIALKYQEPGFIEKIRYWHWLRMNLMPYIYHSALEGAEKSSPMMKPLIYLYQEDPEAIAILDEYIFGDSLLVAPLMEENSTFRRLYLPEGNWYGFFTRKKYKGGQYINSEEKFPVYVLEGSCIPLNIQKGKGLGEEITTTECNLHLLLFGESGSGSIKDDFGVRHVTWSSLGVYIKDSNSRKEDTITTEVVFK